MRASINCRFWQWLCQRILWSFALVFFNDLPGLWVLISWLVHSIFSIFCTRLFICSYSFYISLSFGLKMPFFACISSLYISSLDLTESSTEQLQNANWQLLIPNAWNQLRIIYPLNLSQDNRWQCKWFWNCLSFNCLTMFEQTLIPEQLIEYFCLNPWNRNWHLPTTEHIERDNINSILQRTDIFIEMHFKSHFLLLIIWNFFQN